MQESVAYAKGSNLLVLMKFRNETAAYTGSQWMRVSRRPRAALNQFAYPPTKTTRRSKAGGGSVPNISQHVFSRRCDGNFEAVVCARDQHLHGNGAT